MANGEMTEEQKQFIAMVNANGNLLHSLVTAVVAGTILNVGDPSKLAAASPKGRAVMLLALFAAFLGLGLLAVSFQCFDWARDIYDKQRRGQQVNAGLLDKYNKQSHKARKPRNGHFSWQWWRWLCVLEEQFSMQYIKRSLDLSIISTWGLIQKEKPPDSPPPQELSQQTAERPSQEKPQPIRQSILVPSEWSDLP